MMIPNRWKNKRCSNQVVVNIHKSWHIQYNLQKDRKVNPKIVLIYSIDQGGAILYLWSKGV